MIVSLDEVLAPKTEEEIRARLDRQRRDLEAGIRPASRLGELRKMRSDPLARGHGRVVLAPAILADLEKRVRRQKQGQVAMQVTRSLIETGDGPERR